jgi:hypothetical protein
MLILFFYSSVTTRFPNFFLLYTNTNSLVLKILLSVLSEATVLTLESNYHGLIPLVLTNFKQIDYIQIVLNAEVLVLSTDGFPKLLRSSLKFELQVSTWMCGRLGTPIPDGNLVDAVALKGPFNILSLSTVPIGSHRVPGGTFLSQVYWAKRKPLYILPGFEANDSPPNRAEVKNTWIYICTSPYAFMA